MSFLIEKPAHDTSASNFGSLDSFVYIHPDPSRMDSLPIIAKKWCIEPTFMPSKYVGLAKTIYDLDVRTDDTWVISYPKSGTIWTLEMVWLIANDLDFAKAQQIYQHERTHFVERCVLNGKYSKSIEDTIAAPSPRFIMTHLPVALLPNALWTVCPKIVYVSRNPKDTAVSQYHFFSNLRGWRGSFNDFMELVLKDELSFAPFHSHVYNFWHMRDEKNIQFVTYEEMKTNLFDVLKRTSTFLGKSFDDEQLKKAEIFLSFDNMKQNNSVNRIHMSLDSNAAFR